jgi:hypothetical protein
VKAARRDAKVAAAKARGREKPAPRAEPRWGLLDLFRSFFGHHPTVLQPRRAARLARLRRWQAACRVEIERLRRQARDEAECDARFRRLSLAVARDPGRHIHPKHRRARP